MARKNKKISSKKEVKKLEKSKPNKNTVFLGTFALIIILILIVYYSGFIQVVGGPETTQETQTPTTTETELISEGGCNRDTECFVTYCEGSEQDCVNTTQLSGYSENCESYSDWKIEMQDFSKCACVQGSCKMI